MKTPAPDNAWKDVKAFALEKGKRPESLESLQEGASRPLPPELDRLTQTRIRERVASLKDQRPIVSGRSPWLLPGSGLAAAAAVVLALGLWWFGAGQTSAPFVLVRSVGGVEINGVAPESARSLTPGDRIDLPRDAVVYLDVDASLLLRVMGPGRLELIPSELPGGQEVRLRRGSLDLRSRGKRKEHPGTFRIRTDRARYLLLGTTARLESRDDADTLEVLEGRIEVRPRSATSGTIVTNEERFALPGPGAPRTLEAYRIQRLQRMGANLSSKTAVLENETRENSHLSLDEIRDLYGGVTEYGLQDGRVLRGHLIVRDGNSFIVTPNGTVPIRQSEIQSFTNLD